MSAEPTPPSFEAGAVEAAGSDDGMVLASAVVASLLRAGVREVVVCAGARNAALIAVLAQTSSLRLWSFPEERCAAFFALGRVLALDTPVAVLTTSGTAVAELLPAVIEAYYQSLPLVLVTADRPRSFRGTGAPQAIEQTGMFSMYVAACGDVASLDELAAFGHTLAAWDRRRPVQMNVCLGEPSAAALARAEAAAASPLPAPTEPRASATGLTDFLADAAAGRLVAVVAALPASEQSPVAAFLQRLGCPVIAEATSGLRERAELASQVVHGTEAALARLPVGRVLRLGAVPSSRWWRDLEKRPAVRVFSLTRSGFPGLARPSDVGGFPDWDTVVIPAEPARPFVSEAAEELSDSALAVAMAAHPRSEPALVHALSSAIARDSLVFLGNSLPIREWNVFATTTDRGLRCHANRGANGIDGCVSTFLGLGADEADSTAIIGDLTALYDLAALWITPALPAARRRLVVINNGGGRIFSRVAALRDLPTAPRRLMENPHALAFRAWAEMFGWDYALATTPQDIHSAMARAESRLLIEVVPDGEQTEALWQMVAPSSISEGISEGASGVDHPMPTQP